MVESNSNRFRSPSVFKTVLGPAQITLHKYCMSIRNYVEIIEELLAEKRAEAGYNNESVKMQIIYDRGYLIGLLAMLAHYDNYNAHHITSRMKRFKNKK